MFNELVVIALLIMIGVVLILNRSGPMSVFVGICMICLGCVLLGIDS